MEGRATLAGGAHGLGEHLVVGDRLRPADLMNARNRRPLQGGNERLREVADVHRLEA